MKRNFKRGSARRGVPPDRHGSVQREKIYIYGKHALTEALLNAPRAVRKVFLSGEAVAGDDGAELRALVKKAGVPSETMRGHNEADRMVGEDTAHQGVIAIVDPSAMMVSFEEFVAKNFGDGKHSDGGAKKFPDEKTMLILLDELTDPHNVGAIIRSAAAFGAAGVLMPSHNQAPITGAVVKASAGMAFRVPLVSIGNVNQTVDALRNDFGFRTYGLAMDGAQVLAEESFDAPALVIVGNEGKGIRQKTLERCDVTLRIPMDERTESLNASVSAAVVMYQWSAKHLIIS
jgi:23S rRNA (guanosine2251-2'-O)-methyltransferase